MGLPKNKYRGKNHWSWKGDKVGYAAIHVWLKNTYGKPPKCDKCGQLNDNSNINWALINGKKHQRKRKNYWRLCDKCHINYDGITGKRIKKGQRISPKTEIKKGQRLSPKTEFKKGQTYFHLHKLNCQCFYCKNTKFYSPQE